MPSLPLGSTDGWTASSVACHHLLWTAHTVVNVGRGMTLSPLDYTHVTSPPLDSTHSQQRRAWHDIAAFGQHTRSNDVGHGMPSSPLGSTHGGTTSDRLWRTNMIGNVGRGMTLAPLNSTHGLHRQAWHDIPAFGQHARSDVRRDMPSPPLDNTHSRQRQAWHEITALGRYTRLTTLGVAC